MYRHILSKGNAQNQNSGTHPDAALVGLGVVLYRRLSAILSYQSKGIQLFDLSL
jgi:hypothetical protein